MSSSKFLSENKEDADYNQYWYSPSTIGQIVEDLVSRGGKIGFLSTPSIYFSLPDELRSQCFVFDFDKKWESDRGFVFYDFRDPTNIPQNMLGTFDVLVVDPPFIVREVWEKYAVTSKLLLKQGNDTDGNPSGKVILTTVIENAPFLLELLGAKPTKYQPSIPNLVYQYNLFTNYSSPVFDKRNPEIPE